MDIFENLFLVVSVFRFFGACKESSRENKESSVWKWALKILVNTMKVSVLKSFGNNLLGKIEKIASCSDICFYLSGISLIFYLYVGNLLTIRSFSQRNFFDVFSKLVLIKCGVKSTCAVAGIFSAVIPPTLHQKIPKNSNSRVLNITYTPQNFP